jgi:hypothetical protein
VTDPAPQEARTLPTAPTGWSGFRRHELSALMAAVRAVATAGEPGAHGHGVEIVVESPPLRWWQRVRDRSPRDQARIAVTGDAGAVGYPIHIRLVTRVGTGAVRRVERRDRWATSVTTVAPPDDRHLTRRHPVGGEAILMLKRGNAAGFDVGDAAAEVVTGTVAALDDLHPFSPTRGWRFRVDRDVRRH